MATEIKWADGNAVLAESTVRWADGGVFQYYYEAEEPAGTAVPVFMHHYTHNMGRQ